MSLTQFKGWKGSPAETVSDGAVPALTSLCQNCGQRPATENWTGDGGSLAFVHGFYQRWCKLCCVRKSLECAIEVASRIPDLKKQLEEELAK